MFFRLPTQAKNNYLVVVGFKYGHQEINIRLVNVPILTSWQVSIYLTIEFLPPGIQTFFEPDILKFVFSQYASAKGNIHYMLGILA